MKVILYRHKSGCIAICSPSQEGSLEHAIADILPKDAPYKVCEVGDLYLNPYFVSCFKYDETETPVPVTVDVAAAHEVQKARWREAREPLLKKLDVEWMRAIETGNTALASEITSKKQILRDVTLAALPSRTTGETVEVFCSKLSSMWPDCLKE